jgi:photosystem II stability/assembly factor-like uncharacterized protein
MKKLCYAALFLLITSGINAQWNYSNFPEGSNITQTAKNGNTLFATTIYNIYTSANDGQDWTIAQIPQNYITAQQFAFRNSEAYVAATNGIFKSTDQGLSWTRIMSVVSDYLSCIIVKGDTIFAGAAYNFYRSVDNGKNWTTISLTPTQQSIRDIELKGDSLLASNHDGLYLSINNGNTWAKINQSELYLPSELIRIKNTLVIRTAKNVMSSTDGGKNWTDTGLAAGWITSDNSIGYACGEKAVYTSVDGVSWSKTANFPMDRPLHMLTVSGSNFYLGAESGVYISNNSGGTWTFANKGIYALEVLDMTHTTSTIYACTVRGLMASNDEGLSWKNLTPGIAISKLKIIGTTFYAATHHKPGVLFSTDNGLTWTSSNSKFDRYVTDFLLIDKTIFAATDNSIYTSTDGIKWTDLADDLPNFPVMNAVWQLQTDGSSLYANASNGLYRSDDHGKSWSILKNPPFNSTDIIAIAVQEHTIVAASLEGLYLSTDKGLTWKEIGPYHSPLFAVTFIGGDLFTGGFWGDLYISNNLGKNWTSISTGLPGYGHYINIIRRNEKLFLGTFTGVYYRSVSEVPIGIKKEMSNAPTFKNYPNPCNGLFTVDELDNNSTIEVVTVLGKIIYKAEHVSDKQLIDLREQENGVYFIRITTASGKVSCSKVAIRE